MRNFSKFSSFGDLLWEISWEILENKFSWLIPLKFSRIFSGSEFWDWVSRNSWEFLRNFFQEIPENFSEIFFQKFLRIFQNFSQEILWIISEYFSRNSWEILRSPILRIFWGTFPVKIPEHFYGIFLWKFLRNSREIITRNSPAQAKPLLLYGESLRNYSMEKISQEILEKILNFLSTFSPDFHVKDSSEFPQIFCKIVTLTRYLGNSKDSLKNMRVFFFQLQEISRIPSYLVNFSNTPKEFPWFPGFWVIPIIPRYLVNFLDSQAVTPSFVGAF